MATVKECIERFRNTPSATADCNYWFGLCESYKKGDEGFETIRYTFDGLDKGVPTKTALKLDSYDECVSEFPRFINHAKLGSSATSVSPKAAPAARRFVILEYGTAAELVGKEKKAVVVVADPKKYKKGFEDLAARFPEIAVFIVDKSDVTTALLILDELGTGVQGAKDVHDAAYRFENGKFKGELDLSEAATSAMALAVKKAGKATKAAAPAVPAAAVPLAPLPGPPPSASVANDKPRSVTEVSYATARACVGTKGETIVVVANKTEVLANHPGAKVCRLDRGNASDTYFTLDDLGVPEDEVQARMNAGKSFNLLFKDGGFNGFFVDPAPDAAPAPAEAPQPEPAAAKAPAADKEDAFEINDVFGDVIAANAEEIGMQMKASGRLGLVMIGRISRNDGERGDDAAVELRKNIDDAYTENKLKKVVDIMFFNANDKKDARAVFIALGLMPKIKELSKSTDGSKREFSLPIVFFVKNGQVVGTAKDDFLKVYKKLGK